MNDFENDITEEDIPDRIGTCGTKFWGKKFLTKMQLPNGDTLFYEGDIVIYPKRWVDEFVAERNRILELIERRKSIRD